MRKIDLMRTKAAKTLNFDYDVLKKLEELAQERGTSVSSLVNDLLKQIIMNEKEYYKKLAKYHCSQMHLYRVMSEGLIE